MSLIVRDIVLEELCRTPPTVTGNGGLFSMWPFVRGLFWGAWAPRSLRNPRVTHGRVVRGGIRVHEHDFTSKRSGRVSTSQEVMLEDVALASLATSRLRPPNLPASSALRSDQSGQMFQVAIIQVRL
jgi:hypothetical protein